MYFFKMQYLYKSINKISCFSQFIHARQENAMSTLNDMVETTL